MKKAFEFLLTIIAMVVAGAIARDIVRGGMNSSPKPNTDQMIFQVASELNKRLPMMVDSETRLDSTVPGENKSFKYLYTFVNYRSTEVDSSIVADFAPTLRKNVCGSTDMAKALKLGFTAVYIYRGNDGVEVGQVSVQPSDCGY